MRPYVSTSTVILIMSTVLLVGFGLMIGISVSTTLLGYPKTFIGSAFGYAVLSVLGLVALTSIVVNLVMRLLRAKETLIVDDSGWVSIRRSTRCGVPKVREPLDLDEVAYVTWDVGLFAPSGTEAILFWDRDPLLWRVPLAEIPRSLISASPTAEMRLRLELARRIAAGTLHSSIDVATWEPLGEKLPDTRAWISLEGRRRNIIHRPSCDGD